MPRWLGACLFVLASLVGGPVVYMAASIALVNLVRGIVLFIPAIFDLSDFSFLVHFIPMAIAALIAWGIVLGVSWLAGQAVFERPTLRFSDEGVEQLASGTGLTADQVEAMRSRSGKWLLVLLTLLAVALVVDILLSLWFRGMTEYDLLRLVESGLDAELLGVVLAGLLFMPLSLATYSMARMRMDLANGRDPVAAIDLVGFLGCPVVLIAWLILQWVSGGLF